ncbi:hypothetical protein MNBD_GAMMA10-1890, partial [hydrothermal vent metagenome]
MKKLTLLASPLIKKTNIMGGLVLSTCALLYPAHTTAVVPVFQDVALEAGISHGGSGLFGGGAVWIDYNNDGYADLFIPNENAGPANDFTPDTGANRLYRNNQDGSFTEIAAQANVEMLGRTCTGSVAGDINNDGFDDLFVTCGFPTTSTDPAAIPSEQNALLLNKGDGSFEDISARAGLLNSGGRNPSYAAAFGDLDRDGDLDLYVGNYVANIENAAGQRVKSCVPNQLFINNGDSTFSEMSQAYNVAGAGCTLAVTLSDFDFDGDLDIFEVNDFAPSGFPPNAVYQNNGVILPFTDVAADTGLQAGVYGMGISSGDYDNDLDLDYYISSMGGNVLYQGDATHIFNNVGAEAGVLDALSHPDFPQVAVAWGSAFMDADNDGYLDLYVANGGTGFTADGCTGVLAQCINRFYQNNHNGTFSDVTFESGTANNPGSPLGVATADYDLDGDIDIFVTNLFGERANLYRNETPGNPHFLQVRLNASASNRRGTGSKIRLSSSNAERETKQIRELHAGSSHASSHEIMAHFGLPAGSTISNVSVEWQKPHGLKETQVLRNVDIDQHLQINEIDISSIWPASVPAGQGVIVEGKNLCRNECNQSFPTEVQVTINGVNAQVTWVTPTLLVLALPDSTPAGISSVTLTTPDGEITSAEQLEVLAPLPVITAINPDTLPIGQGGFITGQHFCLHQCNQTNPDEVSVNINGTAASVTWVTPTLIVFAVNAGTPQGL